MVAARGRDRCITLRGQYFEPGAHCSAVTSFVRSGGGAGEAACRTIRCCMISMSITCASPRPGAHNDSSASACGSDAFCAIHETGRKSRRLRVAHLAQLQRLRGGRRCGHPQLAAHFVDAASKQFLAQHADTTHRSCFVVSGGYMHYTCAHHLQGRCSETPNPKGARGRAMPRHGGVGLKLRVKGVAMFVEGPHGRGHAFAQLFDVLLNLQQHLGIRIANWRQQVLLLSRGSHTIAHIKKKSQTLKEVAIRIKKWSCLHPVHPRKTPSSAQFCS